MLCPHPPKKNPHERCRMGRCINVMRLISSLGLNATVTQDTSSVNGVSLPTD